MATIGSYAQQLSLMNRLNMNYAAANKNMEHIATGNKINSPADDASGYSIGKSIFRRNRLNYYVYLVINVNSYAIVIHITD